jgi:hypothetical protein
MKNALAELRRLTTADAGAIKTGTVARVTGTGVVLDNGLSAFGSASVGQRVLVRDGQIIATVTSTAAKRIYIA